MCEDLCRHSKDCKTFMFAINNLGCSLSHVRVDCLQTVLFFDIAQTGTFKDLGDLVGGCQKGSKIFQGRSGRLRCDNKIPQCNSFSELHKSCKEGKLLEVQNIPSQKLEEITCMSHNHRTSITEMCKVQVTLFDFLSRRDCYLKEKKDVRTNGLFLAGKGGDVKIVRKLTGDEKRDMNYTRKQDTIPVISAVIYRQKNVFDFLISRNCNLTSGRNKISKVNILHWACSVGSVDMINYVLTKGSINIESRAVYGQTAILKAVFHGHINIVKMLMKRCCNMTVVDNNKENILFYSCKGGHLDMIKYILSKDVVSKEGRGKHGDTVLLWAARYGKNGIIKLLISHGCNPMAVNAIGENILHLASRYNKLETVKYILSKGLVNINSRGYLRQTALFCAAHNGHLKVFMFLVSKGCNMKILDVYHQSILHSACHSRHPRTVKYILSKNIVSIDRHGRYGRTPIMEAIRSGSLAVVKLLVSKGCSLLREDFLGNTVAHFACKKGNVAIVKYLHRFQVLDKKKKNIQGQTPFDLAKPNIRDIIR